MHNTPDNWSYITQVAVKSEFQNRGIFKKLFREYEAFATSIGIEGIWLTVREDNYTARMVYSKVGFIEVEHDSAQKRFRLEKSLKQ